MPSQIPSVSTQFLEAIGSLSFQEISFEVAKCLLNGEIPDTALRQIIDDAINFDAPLIRISEGVFVLELFHGPTLAFKDFGARFMARLMSYFTRNENRQLTILVATSGDTGSAVAHGFFRIEGIRVVLLYPSGKVSDIQEKQMTTLGENITALEIAGAFDDCQSLVKQAFLDQDLNEQMNLTSANSINIARLIPQSFYYFFAFSQLKEKNHPVVFSVPSGNFGNLTAGLLAKKMGLPISKFVAATNSNDVVPQYLRSGLFMPRPSIQTISNAMDVGNPSNFVRMLALHGNDLDAMRFNIYGAAFSDQQTKTTIKEVFEQYRYLLDPHGAVGYLGLNDYLKKASQTVNGIFLETAHPAKFLDIVKEVLGTEIEIPERLKKCLTAQKQSASLSCNFDDFKSFLLTP